MNSRPSTVPAEGTKHTPGPIEQLLRDQEKEINRLRDVQKELLAFVKQQYDATVCICGVKSKLLGTRFETDLECTKCVAEKLIAKAEGQ